ncbi:MAG: hypothetical protein GH159_03055, partial [Dehalococcoidia bacterium]|nr:hypothetical protein [Dehalococcoidia bacterium]
MMGFILSIEPRKACARPMRPPFLRYSRVSKAARKSTRGTVWRATSMTSSSLAPPLAALAAVY